MIGIYSDFPHENRLGRLAKSIPQFVRELRKSDIQSIYRAFGAKKFLRPRRSARIRVLATEAKQKALSAITTKRELENYSISGVLLGDLIYDQYLAEFKEVTLNLNDVRVEHILERALELFFFWQSYFDSTQVAAVFGYQAYLAGIPARVAIARGIEAFDPSTHLQRIFPPESGNIFADVRKEFALVARPSKAEELEFARKYLRAFVEGLPVEPLAGHSFKSFLFSEEEESLQVPPRDTVVLIAPHNPFSDSPHAIGRSLFPDYGEWLEYLGELSSTLDYAWLLKMHPDFRDQEEITQRQRDWLTNLCSRYPNVQLLPDNISHGSLINSGVNAVLTVSGSIGFEYAARGIRVINASPDNPHQAYAFNLSPQNLNEYEIALRSLGTLHWDINFDEIVEYFFMSKIEMNKSPFFGDLNKATVQNKIGDYSNRNMSEYDLAINSQNPNISDPNLKKSLVRFFESNDRRWYERHSSGPS